MVRLSLVFSFCRLHVILTWANVILPANYSVSFPVMESQNMFHRGIVDGSYFQVISLLNLVLDINYLLFQLYFTSVLLRYWDPLAVTLCYLQKAVKFLYYL